MKETYILPPIDNAAKYIRLPKTPSHCLLTGLSRSALNELILPSTMNNFKPPVRSVVIKKKHAVKGIRLINVESLLNHLEKLSNLQPA